MKDERDNKFVPFPAGLLAGALVLTGVMLMPLLVALFSMPAAAKLNTRPGQLQTSPQQI